MHTITGTPFLISASFTLGLMILHALRRYDVAVTLFLAGVTAVMAMACLALLSERFAPGSTPRTFESANFIFGAI